MSYVDKPTRYFPKPGPQNTEATLLIAKERAKELNIRDIVIASTYGDTGFKALEIFKDMNVNIVVVTIAASSEEEGWIMRPEIKRKLEKMGAFEVSYIIISQIYRLPSVERCILPSISSTFLVLLFCLELYRDEEKECY